MNSTIRYIRVLAAAMCGVLLVGCDAIKDVRDAPFTALPSPQALIGGKIIGLGTARAVVLSRNGQPNCLAPDPLAAQNLIPVQCKFYGKVGQTETVFSFGSFAIDSADADYTITVVQQPYGKICTVANASGHAGDGGPEPVVTCQNDPAAARYDLTVNIPGALQALSNLTITLQSEDGYFPMDATGLASVVFPGSMLNSLTSLPLFGFKLVATTDTGAGSGVVHNLCAFTPTATFTRGGENRASATNASVVPTGPVSVDLAACEFQPGFNVQFDTGGTGSTTMGGSGIEVALVNHLTQEIVESKTAATFSATEVQFSPIKANADALYEMVVTQHPTGQHCVVYGTTNTWADTTNATAGIENNIVAPMASAVVLIDPSNTDWWAFANRNIRCRNVPTGTGILMGTYQIDRRQVDGAATTIPNPNFDPNLPSTGDTTGTNPLNVNACASLDPLNPTPIQRFAPATACYTNPGRGQEYLTFFDDGTFLFGINFNGASKTASFPNHTFTTSAATRGNNLAASGVQHGFYTYNQAAGTIQFYVRTATNILPSGRSLTGMPTIAGVPTARQVVKGVNTDGLGTLSMWFCSTANLATPCAAPAAGATNANRRWDMSEPPTIPGEITGAWIEDSHLRTFAYEKSFTFAFHMGVNGYGNLQNVCMIPTDDSTQSSGWITKHAGSATVNLFTYTCSPGAVALPVSSFAPYDTRNIDLPHYAPKNSAVSTLAGPTTPRRPDGFEGRFPSSNSQLDLRPNSPADFNVVPGNPDVMTVYRTINGTRVEPGVVWKRYRAN